VIKLPPETGPFTGKNPKIAGESVEDSVTIGEAISGKNDLFCFLMSSNQRHDNTPDIRMDAEPVTALKESSTDSEIWPTPFQSPNPNAAHAITLSNL
jgi:hypothetical protein